MQSRAPMLLRRLAPLALTCNLLLACAHAPPPALQAPAPQPSPYLTIEPEVSVSATARPVDEKQASADLDPNADVMAEILAIPPGR